MEEGIRAEPGPAAQARHDGQVFHGLAQAGAAEKHPGHQHHQEGVNMPAYAPGLIFGGQQLFRGHKEEVKEPPYDESPVGAMPYRPFML